MAAEILMTPRDFCDSHDEWFPVATLHWDAKPNNLLEKLLSQSVPQPVAMIEADAFQLERDFLREAAVWERETKHLSSTTRRVLHQSYQNIIRMGMPVVPFLLRDLRTNRRLWFWALREITETDPVKPQYAGNVDKMIAAWVDWGIREGKI